MAAPAAAVVFDLDGTLYRGDAPLRAYARAMAERAPRARADEIVRRTEAFLADGQAFSPFRDAWAQVSAFGGDAGLDWPERDRAFLAVREAICRGEVAVEVPEGLAAFVAALDRRVRVAVLTNSEGESARRLVAALGLGRLAGAVRGAVRKPQGFAVAAAEILGSVDAAVAISVGDNYVNDVAPALTLGMRAVHVRRPGATGGPVHVRVDRLERALPWLERRLDAALARAGRGGGGPLADADADGDTDLEREAVR